VVLLTGCSLGSSTATTPGSAAYPSGADAAAGSSGPGTTDGNTGTASAAASSTPDPSSGSPSSGTSPTAGGASSPTPTSKASAAAGALTVTAPLAPGSLRGKVFAIDPGHNGGNGSHPAQINRTVMIGNGSKACDTTGTQTDAGYTEAAFTWDVSQRLAAILRAAGATVVLSRSNNTGVGPCITERAAFGNRAHATAAISIHGDGAPASGYGFHLIEPASIGSNRSIVTPSATLGTAVRAAFAAGTGEHYSTYTGGGRAVTVRSDLGGLNLSAVPKVFIECGNMRNAADARRLSSPTWRQQAALALAKGLAQFASTH
jgi:N-acetylmuramoyl-L-alanine amidase